MKLNQTNWIWLLVLSIINEWTIVFSYNYKSGTWKTNGSEFKIRRVIILYKAVSLFTPLFFLTNWFSIMFNFLCEGQTSISLPVLPSFLSINAASDIFKWWIVLPSLPCASGMNSWTKYWFDNWRMAKEMCFLNGLDSGFDNLRIWVSRFSSSWSCPSFFRTTWKIINDYQIYVTFYNCMLLLFPPLNQHNRHFWSSGVKLKKLETMVPIIFYQLRTGGTMLLQNKLGILKSQEH